ncbi:MAG: PEP-CTERM sorting domain-containing protein [Pirellulales bacterium]
MIRAFIGLLVIGSCGVSQAAPLLYFTLEGRKQGSAEAFANSIEVETGDVIEYRLQMRMAPFGIHNDNVRATHPTFAGKHGVNSMSLAIVQDSAAPIQVDLSSPAEFSWPPPNAWGRGFNARGGAPVQRAGSAFRDLLDIRPIQPPGVFVGGTANEAVLAGTFNVAVLTGGMGQVWPQWGTVSGGGAFEGGWFPITGVNWNRQNGESPTETSTDPITHFSSLELTAGNPATVPEPSTLALAGIALAGLTLVRRKVQSAAIDRRAVD